MKRGVALVLWPILGVSSALGWGFRGHEMAARVAASALPEEMPRFFRQAAERLAYLCPEPDRWRTSTAPALMGLTEPDHYFDLELWGAEPIPPTRYDLLLAAIRRGLVAEGKPVRDPGTAPVAVAELAERLVVNFRHWRETSTESEQARLLRRQVEENVIYTAGVVGHFVTDLSNPLHNTVHHNGWQPGYPNPRGFLLETPEQDLHSRFEAIYVDQAIAEKDIAALLSPPRRLGQEPAQSAGAGSVWVREMEQFIRRNNGFVERVYELEQKAAFGSGQEPPEARAFTAARLADGAAMLRDLWHTAWLISREEWLADPVRYRGKAGRTALELLRERRRVETRSYDWGQLVVAVGNRRNGLEGRYWHYYVNGKPATTAADRYRTAPGERIEWRFEPASPTPPH